MSHFWGYCNSYLHQADDNVLNLDCSDGYILLNVLKTIEYYTIIGMCKDVISKDVKIKMSLLWLELGVTFHLPFCSPTQESLGLFRERFESHVDFCLYFPYPQL